MLGGDPVGDGHRLVQVVGNQDHPPLGKRGAGDLGPAQLFKLRFQFRRHLSGDLLAGGDQHGERQRVVFGLGQEVGGDMGGVGVLVGDDQHLAGAGDHVDLHPPRHLPLGLGDELVAGADDHIRPGHGFGAEGQRGDGPRRTRLVDLGDADLLGGHQQRRVHRAVG